MKQRAVAAERASQSMPRRHAAFGTPPAGFDGLGGLRSCSPQNAARHHKSPMVTAGGDGAAVAPPSSSPREVFIVSCAGRRLLMTYRRDMRSGTIFAFSFPLDWRFTGPPQQQSAIAYRYHDRMSQARCDADFAKKWAHGHHHYMMPNLFSMLAFSRFPDIRHKREFLFADGEPAIRCSRTLPDDFQYAG